MLYLQDFPGDVLLAVLTLDAKHGVVVHLTVGDSIPERRTQEMDERGSVWTQHRKQLTVLPLTMQTLTLNMKGLHYTIIIAAVLASNLLLGNPLLKLNYFF